MSKDVLQLSRTRTQIHIDLKLVLLKKADTVFLRLIDRTLYEPDFSCVYN